MAKKQIMRSRSFAVLDDWIYDLTFKPGDPEYQPPRYDVEAVVKREKQARKAAEDEERAERRRHGLW